MKTVALFGGTGGLGSQLAPLLQEVYNVITIGSKYVDVTNYDNVKTFFSNNKIDIVINQNKTSSIDEDIDKDSICGSVIGVFLGK